eukprot:TRINITY_DN866_c0_g1_i10.p1 TRINITY_DN866_c0_g1~~TRINITY_DN866_c0_g1_i10.p1  ORF type:complete len:338 (+),score=54.02 TRINITY_DN866_c0_g1_i10:126-1139(+)
MPSLVGSEMCIRDRKYTNQNRIMTVQSQLTERAVELLNLKTSETNLILDIGCGSGLSGDILTDMGQIWVGIDISRDMMNVAVDRKCQGDLYQIDMGQGFKFRPGTFDAAISVSALQWLCVASEKNQNPYQRLNKFFSSLYNCLKSNGRAVLQFYPDGNEQLDMITKSALKNGFSGGLIVDFPHSSKAKKLYLVLDAGNPGKQEIQQVEGLQGDEEEDDDDEEQKNTKNQNGEKKVEYLTKAYNTFYQCLQIFIFLFFYFFIFKQKQKQTNNNKNKLDPKKQRNQHLKEKENKLRNLNQNLNNGLSTKKQECANWEKKSNQIANTLVEKDGQYFETVV